MSIRQSILDALRVDTLTIIAGGTYTNTLLSSHKMIKGLDQLKDSEYPSNFIQLLPAVGSPSADFTEWKLGVQIVTYIRVAKDVAKSGLLEQQMETFIADYETLFKTYTTTTAISGVKSVEIILIDPLLVTHESKAFFSIGLEIIYQN